jgi:hypothetical protein
VEFGKLVNNQANSVTVTQSEQKTIETAASTVQRSSTSVDTADLYMLNLLLQFYQLMMT